MSFKRVIRLAGLLVLASTLVIGCSGKNGSNGANGTDGINGTNGLSTGTLSGTVVDSASQTPIAGATVALNPAAAANASTDANGNFVFSDIPIGSYQVVVSASGYNQFTSSIIPVVAGITSTTQVAIVHGAYQAPLIAGLNNQFNVGYHAAVTVTAAVTDPNNLPVTCQWTITSPLSTAPVLSGSTSCSSVSFTTDTFDALVANDPSLVDPVGGLLVQRDTIIPISYNEMGTYTLKLTATNSKGVQSSSSITVRASDRQPSIENVALGAPVYINFIESSPNAQLTTVPSGSSATISMLSSAAAGPYTIATFTPDKAGIYNITSSGSSFTIVAGTFVGAYDAQGNFGGVFNTSGCQMCHNNSIAPDVFTTMGQTPHASIFINGINGGSGTTGASCYPCHTVGYDQAPATATNNGFGWVAAQYGFVFPSVRQPGNWTAMLGQYPTVAALANIQCENCHGPNASLAHGSGADQLFERVGWSAGVCNQCHDAPSHHVMGTQWQSSAHAQYDLAINEGTIQNSPDPAHCGRCHTAQGFAAYVDQVSAYGFTGATNYLGFGTLTDDQLAGIGLTVSQVQPQTCQACHDPHQKDSNPSSSGDSQLRVYGNTELAAGFTVDNVGAGALCMQCHNTRNGLHNDSVPLTYSSMFPHTPSQADILMGQNSYFTGITGTTTVYVSKHANVADTCVTCHMQLNPNNPWSASFSHEFDIPNADQGQLCANCHGSTEVTGYGLQTEVQGLLSTIHAAILTDAAAVINSSASTVYAGTQALTLPVTVTGISGYGTANVALTDATSTTVSIAINKITTTTGYVFPIDGTNITSTVVIKSLWNYGLVDTEGSYGIHNPTYELTILNNTLSCLNDPTGVSCQ